MNALHSETTNATFYHKFAVNALSAVGTKGKSCRLDVCLFCIAIGVHIQVFLVGGWLLEHPEYDA